MKSINKDNEIFPSIKTLLVIFILFLITFFSFIYYISKERRKSFIERRKSFIKEQEIKLKKEQEAIKLLQDSHSYIKLDNCTSLVWIDKHIYKIECVRDGKYSNHLEIGLVDE
jgi:uncharacterized protein YeeX (DUF496 family)